MHGVAVRMYGLLALAKRDATEAFVAHDLLR